MTFFRLPPSSTLRLGRLIARRYRLLMLLGAGRHGQVFRARDEASGQMVVLKGAPGRRLLVEGEIQAQLAHPHIPAVRASFAEWGHSFLVMDEVVGGRTLADYRAHWPFSSPTLHTLAFVLAEQVVQVLAHLHRRSLYHGDITPTNLMLGQDGRCMLLDFSTCNWLLARLYPPPSIPPDYGTSGFQAPEHTEEILPTARRDVFGLGASLWYLIQGSAPLWVYATRRLPQYRQPRACGDLRHLMMRLLHPNPAARLTLREAEQMLAHLRALFAPRIRQQFSSATLPLPWQRMLRSWLAQHTR